MVDVAQVTLPGVKLPRCTVFLYIKTNTREFNLTGTSRISCAALRPLCRFSHFPSCAWLSVRQHWEIKIPCCMCVCVVMYLSPLYSFLYIKTNTREFNLMGTSRISCAAPCPLCRFSIVCMIECKATLRGKTSPLHVRMCVCSYVLLQSSVEDCECWVWWSYVHALLPEIILLWGTCLTFQWRKLKQYALSVTELLMVGNCEHFARARKHTFATNVSLQLCVSPVELLRDMLGQNFKVPFLLKC